MKASCVKLASCKEQSIYSRAQIGGTGMCSCALSVIRHLMLICNKPGVMKTPCLQLAAAEPCVSGYCQSAACAHL